jgi:putative methionine-R-sulfoxide reductase with GAF domain
MTYTIKNKLILGFAALLMLLVISSWMGLSSLSDMNSRLNDLIDISAEKVKLAARINQDIIMISRAEKNIILSSTQEEMDEFAKFIDDTEESMKKKRKFLSDLVDVEGQVLLESFRSTWKEYMRVNKELRVIARLNSNVRARNLSQNEARDAYDKASLTITQIVEKNDEETDQAKNVKTLRKIAEKIKLAARINRNLVEIQRGEKNLILARTQDEMDEYAKAIKRIREDLIQRIDQLQPLTSREGKIQLNRFQKEVNLYLNLHEEVRKLSRENANVRAFNLSSGKARELNDKAQDLMASIVDKNDMDMAKDKIASDKNYSNSQFQLISLSVFAIIMGLLIAYLIISTLTKGFDQVIKSIRTVSFGDTTQLVTVTNKDEIGEILITVNEMIISLKKMTEVTTAIAQNDYGKEVEVRSDKDALGKSINLIVKTLKGVVIQANTIAEGNYETKFTPRNNNDYLGIALLSMTNTLRKNDIENKRSDWFKTGQNKLNEKMREASEIKTLSRNVITFLANYLEAQMGAFYLVEANGAELKLSGSYAFDKDKNSKNLIQIGEGLIGQAAYEKEIISVTNIPEDYTRVSSAIGAATPLNIIIVPIILDDRLIGVIELGSLKKFSDDAMELLKLSIESIANVFFSVLAKEKESELLEETQRQSEELLSRQEELLKTNEELSDKVDSNES